MKKQGVIWEQYKNQRACCSSFRGENGKKKKEKKIKFDQNEKNGSLRTKEQKYVEMEGLGWNWHD